MIKKLALTVLLVLSRITIMAGLTSYKHNIEKNKIEKASKSFHGLEASVNDLKEITVNRQLEGYRFKSDTQQELAQIGFKYEELESSKENTIALAEEWANTLYPKIDKSLIWSLVLFPFISFGFFTFQF